MKRRTFRGSGGRLKFSLPSIYIQKLEEEMSELIFSD